MRGITTVSYRSLLVLVIWVASAWTRSTVMRSPHLGHSHRVAAAAAFAWALLFSVSASGEPFGAEIRDSQQLQPAWSQDVGHDFAPEVATDGNGTWVVVWKSELRTGCTLGEFNIVYSRSTDGGQTWTPPAPLSSGPEKTSPVLATNGQGVWIAAWTEDNSNTLQIARSVDNGATWSGPRLLDGVSNSLMSIASDGNGHWIIVGYEWFGGCCDNEILFFRSADDGLNWTPARPLNTDFEDEEEQEGSPQVIHDGHGRWLVVWRRDSGFFADNVLFARSDDDGATWSSPQLLSDSDPTTGYDWFPTITANGPLLRVAVWSSSLGGQVNRDLWIARSLDGSDTWSTPQPVFEDAGLGDGSDWFQQVAADGSGNLVMVWDSRATLYGTLGTDQDVLVSRSVDGGVSWSDPTPLNTYADTDTAGDPSPGLAGDGRGNWIGTWHSFHDFGAANNWDGDIVFNRFRLPFPTTCPTDADGDGFGIPGDPACPMGPAEDCDDTNVDVAPGVPELCDGVNNDCTNPAWPDPTGIDTDDDGDGLSECELDCNDADGNSFDIPGEPLIVEAARGPDTTVNFVWDPPQSPGGDPASLRYDVLRSSDASDFLCDATCVEFDDDKDLQASCFSTPLLCAQCPTDCPGELWEPEKGEMVRCPQQRAISRLMDQTQLPAEAAHHHRGLDRHSVPCCHRCRVVLDVFDAAAESTPRGLVNGSRWYATLNPHILHTMPTNSSIRGQHARSPSCCSRFGNRP